MGSSERRRRGSRVTCLATAVALSLTTLVAAAPADRPAALDEGSWIGIGTAGGVATASEGGANFRFTAAIDAGFQLTVAGGATTGTWDFESPIRMTGSGSSEGQSVTLDWIGAVRGGGPATGTARVIQLRGDQHATGAVDVTTAGRTFTAAVNNRTSMPPLEVVIVQASCVDAYGEWVVSLEASAEAEGWTADLDGSWFALREYGADDPSSEVAELKQAIDELAVEVNAAGVAEGLLEPEPGEVPFPLSWDQLVEWVDEAVELTNRLRNLSPCEQEALTAEGAETFFYVLAGTMQNLVVLADVYVLAPADISMLMAAGTTVGAFGSGSPSPARADRVEDLLRAQGERIANENVDVGGEHADQNDVPCTPSHSCLIVSYDMVDTLVTGTQYGWDYTITDRSLPASEWLARLGDAPSRLPERGDG